MVVGLSIVQRFSKARAGAICSVTPFVCSKLGNIELNVDLHNSTMASLEESDIFEYE